LEGGNKNVGSHIKENESLDNALKRFKRSCAKAGVRRIFARRVLPESQCQAPQESRRAEEQEQALLLIQAALRMRVEVRNTTPPAGTRGGEYCFAIRKGLDNPKQMV
jgi:ribosomal protein S21